MTNPSQVKVTLVKSLYGRKPGHMASAHGLGLRKIGQSRVLTDTPEIRGMINAVYYLLKVEEA